MTQPDGPGTFADGKAPDALRTIGEVAAAFGIRQHVLRYWEQQFPMLRPLKRSGGRRYYRADDVALVSTINRLVNDNGYTLKGARQAIENGAGRDLTPPVSTATVAGGAASSEPARDLLPQLRSIRARLAAALSA